MNPRDYSKFINDRDRLNMRLIPRAVWVDMVKRARSREDILEVVLDEMYWKWDVDERVAQAHEEGREITRTEALEELMAEMSDSDWWKLMSAFEEQIMRSFASDPYSWSEFLDPVYDLQEAEGWRDRQ